MIKHEVIKTVKDLIRFRKKTPPKSPVEKTAEVKVEPAMSLEEYLKTLSTVDQENLLSFKESFEKTMRNLNAKGSLMAVGGTVKGKTSGEDIDIVLVIEDMQEDVE